MARTPKRTDWQGQAEDIFKQLLAAMETATNAVGAIWDGSSAEQIAPIYDHGRLAMIAARDSLERFVDKYRGNTKSRDSIRFGATAALPRMLVALKVVLLIARALPKLGDEEDIQALADIEERINVIFAANGSFYSQYRNASHRAMLEFAEQVKIVEGMDDELRELQQELMAVVEKSA